MHRLMVAITGLIWFFCIASMGHAQTELRFPDQVHLVKNLSDALQRNNLPWTIETIEVTVEGNSGSAVTPLVEQRFKATARALEDLFDSRVDFVNPEVFITKRHMMGETVTLYGVARSTIEREAWTTKFALENLGDISDLRPLSTFAERYDAARLFISGTPEGEAARAAVEQRLAEEQRAAAAAIEKERARLAELGAAVGGEWHGFISCGPAHEMTAILQITPPSEGTRASAILSYSNMVTGTERSGIDVALTVSGIAEPVNGRVDSFRRAFGSSDERVSFNLSDGGLEGSIWGTCLLQLERPDAFAETRRMIEAEVAAYLSGRALNSIEGVQTGPKRKPGSEWTIRGTARVEGLSIVGELMLPGFKNVSNISAPIGPMAVPYRILFPYGADRPILSVEPYNRMPDEKGRNRDVSDQYSLAARCTRSMDIAWDADLMEMLITSNAPPYLGCFETSRLRIQ